MGGAWAQTTKRPASGDGTVDNPFLISTAAELAWFRDHVNEDYANVKASAKLIADIDLSEFCHAANASENINQKSWEPIGRYQGTFDGNNKTITNLYINDFQENMGLFGYISQSTIKNLTFVNANVTNTKSNTGILVGEAEMGSTLQNIKISETCRMKGGGEYTGYTGGIAGVFVGNAYNCVNYATVQGTKHVGGLFGSYAGTDNFITACANYGKVTASSEYVGGLVGYFASGTIQDCANYGDVKGSNHVAGLAGYVWGPSKIKNVFCYGSISATDFTDIAIGMAFGYTCYGATEGMVAYYSGAKLTADDQDKL